MKTIEQIEKQIEQADRQIQAYTGSRHGKATLELAILLKASLEKERSEKLNEMAKRYEE